MLKSDATLFSLFFENTDKKAEEMYLTLFLQLSSHLESPATEAFQVWSHNYPLVLLLKSPLKQDVC